MKKAWDFIRSVKLAAVLLAVLCATVLVSFFVPQRALFGTERYAAWEAVNPLVAQVVQALGLDAVYSSWLFLLACVLVLLNLLACTLHRIIKRSRRRLRELAPPASAVRVTSPLSTEEAESAAAAAVGRWTPRRPDSGTGLLLERGRLGWWGSMVLHAGLILLLVAGVVSAMTRFSGTVVLAEGQSLPDAQASYVDVSELPRMGAAFGQFAVGMESMKIVYKDGEIIDAVAVMTADEGSGPRQDTVRVNEPLKVQGKSYLLGKSGHTVAIRVIQPKGNPVAANVNLGESVKQGYADALKLEDGTLSLISVPDYEARDGEATDKLDLRDPAVLVSSGSQAAWLRPGESAQIGPYLVSIADVGLWTTLLVRADKGLPIAYVAFALIIIGMTMRWLVPDGLVALKPAEDATGYHVWYRDRHGSRSAERAAATISAALEISEGSD